MLSYHLRFETQNLNQEKHSTRDPHTQDLKRTQGTVTLEATFQREGEPSCKHSTTLPQPSRGTAFPVETPRSRATQTHHLCTQCHSREAPASPGDALWVREMQAQLQRTALCRGCAETWKPERDLQVYLAGLTPGLSGMSGGSPGCGSGSWPGLRDRQPAATATFAGTKGCALWD